MTFQTIRHAQQEVWPRVRQSIDLRRAQRDAVKNTANPTVAAQSRARIPWNRVVADETVWAIAKADLLATPEQQAVVQAAREWARQSAIAGVQGEFEADERELYSAVQALGSSLRGLEDTGLTPVDAPASLNSSAH